MKQIFLKNKFFYFFYKIKKIFITKKKYHLAEFGEDIFVRRFFQNQEQGFYVDVGCYHPIKSSLTYYLYRKNWKGLNIDLLEENLILFNLFRKKDKNINLAVSKNKGIINAYIFERGSGVNTTNKKWADKWKEKIGKNYSTLKIKKNSLNNVLSSHKIKREFELLNIDVEGHEIEVLKGINFKNIRPKIITIEIHVEKTEQIFETEIYKMLKKNNFELISHYYHTSFFKHKDTKILF